MLTAQLKRGVKAGAVAGLVFGLLLALVANPLVGFADALGHESGLAGEYSGGDHHESAGGDQQAASGDGHGSAVSTTIRNAVSILSGVLWGVLLGGVVFGAVYYFLEPVIPGTGETKSYLLAAAGFLTVSGAPWLVLPPQPPGVEQALPAETRLLLYGGMMVAGALVSLFAGFLYGRLRAAHGRVIAAVVGVFPVGLLAIPAVLSPGNGATHSLPPELATGLTGMVVFGQALLWVFLAGTHARLNRRSGERDSAAVTTSADRPITAD